MQGKVCHLMSEGEIVSVGAHFTRKSWLGAVEMNESSLSHPLQKKKPQRNRSMWIGNAQEGPVGRAHPCHFLSYSFILPRILFSFLFVLAQSSYCTSMHAPITVTCPSQSLTQSKERKMAQTLLVQLDVVRREETL